MPPLFAVFEVKFGWPITRSGVLISSLLAKGFENRRIRLFAISMTYKFPFWSIAIPPEAVKPVVLAVPGPYAVVD